MKDRDLATLVISISALGLSAFVAWSQIVHNELSVEPRWSSYFSNDGEEEKWGIYFINNGEGSAYIDSLNVYVDGKIISDNGFGKFYEATLKLGLRPLCFKFGKIRPNLSIGVGNELFWIHANSKSPKSCAGDKLKLMAFQENRLNYVVKFQSIYRKKFEYEFKTNSQKRI